MGRSGERTPPQRTRAHRRPRPAELRDWAGAKALAAGTSAVGGGGLLALRDPEVGGMVWGDGHLGGYWGAAKVDLM